MKTLKFALVTVARTCAGRAGPTGVGGVPTITMAIAIGDRAPMPTVGDIGAGGEQFGLK
jgi:hypothetical protein